MHPEPFNQRGPSVIASKEPNVGCDESAARQCRGCKSGALTHGRPACSFVKDVTSERMSRAAALAVATSVLLTGLGAAAPPERRREST